MSRQLITEYRSELDRIHAASGSKRESVVREAFKDLLKRWGKSRDLIFLAEHEYITPNGDRRYIDGALVHSIRVPFGYWEAKDTNDDLDEEIRKKTAAGYPRDNIIYEDTDTAVLIQNKREVDRTTSAARQLLLPSLSLSFPRTLSPSRPLSAPLSRVTKWKKWKDPRIQAVTVTKDPPPTRLRVEERTWRTSSRYFVGFAFGRGSSAGFT